MIDNLRIERIEVRAEDDPAIAPYVHEKQIEFIKCEKGGDTLIDTARKVIWSLLLSLFSFPYSLFSLVMPMLCKVLLRPHHPTILFLILDPNPILHLYLYLIHLLILIPVLFMRWRYECPHIIPLQYLPCASPVMNEKSGSLFSLLIYCALLHLIFLFVT